MAEDTIDWQAIRAKFATHFTPDQVDFRVQGGKPFQKDGKEFGVVVAYIDARVVAERLDDVVGPGAWSFDWTPLIMKDNAVTVAKGTLTVHGVLKSDVGDAGQTEPTKSTVSDALKRAAVLWGIGRYLYDLPTQWAHVEVDGSGKIVRLAKGALNDLRAKLPRSQAVKGNAA